MAAEEEIVLVPGLLNVRIGDQEIELTRNQYRILFVLVSNPNQLFSRAELIKEGIGTLVTERTVDAHIKELRRKLGAFATRIQTVRGSGYRYVRG
jgi:DNA-binding response OmpR family regulator